MIGSPRRLRAWVLGVLLCAWVVVPQTPAPAGHWSTVTVGGTPGTSRQTSLALHAGKPRISSSDNESADLEFATCDTGCTVAANWTTVVVDVVGSVGSYSSLALDAGKPRISYEDLTNRDLKYASCEANCTVAANWTKVTVDAVGDVGRFTSLALDAGKPRVSYYDVANGDLKFASCEANCTVAGNWTKVTVDAVGDVGLWTSIALDAGKPRVSYHDTGNGDLRYASCDGSCTVAANWTTVTVDAVGDVGDFNSLALDAGKPRISYYDSALDGNLKYASCDGSCTVAANWTKVAVDTKDDVGKFTSLSLDAGKPRISYSSTTDLKFASCEASCAAAANWSMTAVKLGGSRPSVALDSGKPRISYSGASGLEFASCDGGCAQANPAPSITFVTDAPDPAEAKEVLTFTIGWTDPDPGELVRAVVCKTDAILSGVCAGGTWATGAFSGTSPATASYPTTNLDDGTQGYVAFACDAAGACSSPAPGSFTVLLRPPPAVPSALCQSAGGQRVLDTDAGSGHVWLYAWQESTTRVHLCIRAEADQSLGGRLTVDDSGTLISVSADATDPPCTVHLVEHPAFGLWHSPLGQTPVSLCLLAQATGQGVRVTLDPAGAPSNPSVTWTPDPGTPGLPPA